MPNNNSATDAHITVRRRRRQAEALDKENLPSKATDNNHDSLSSFLRAAEQTCQASYWKNQSSLAALVVETSLRREKGKVTTTENPREEAALLSSARKVIKEATENKKIAEPCLLVGLTTLRALHCRHEPERVEAIIKCLYHIITNGESSGTTYWCSLVAYETLGDVLLQYTCALDSKKMIVFERPKQEISFPIPIVQKRRKDCELGSLPLEQLSTIGSRASLTVARIVAKLAKPDSRLQNETSLETMSNNWRINTSDDCMAHLKHTLLDVLPKWVSVSAFNKGINEKDVQHHCKSSYQILLQAASDSSSGKDDTLTLRLQAIQSLLGVNLEEAFQSCVATKYFETACHNACKFSAGYVQETLLPCPVDQSHALARFHQEIGSTLDTLATQYKSNSYIEYCAYRVKHVGWSSCMKPSRCSSPSCLFGRLKCGIYVHSDCRQGLDAATMALFLVSTQICYRLGNSDNDQWFSKDDCQYVVDNFISVSSGASQRHFRLLWSTSLQRIVQELVAQDDPSKLLLVKDDLEIAASVIGNCFAPLALAECTEDTRNQAWDYFFCCFRTAISTYEALHGESLQECNNERSNDMVSTLIKTYFLERKECPVPESCIESAAKFLSSVGRRRNELNTDAVAPLLFSLRLFHLLPHERWQTLQLSSRWSYLVSIYKARDLTHEAFLASACTVASADKELVNIRPTDESTVNVLFRELVNASGLYTDADSEETQVEATNMQRRAVISKLVGAWFDIPALEEDYGSIKSRKLRCLSPVAAIDALITISSNSQLSVAQEFEKKSHCPYTLSGVTTVLLTNTLSDLESFSLVKELMICCGRAVQKQVQQDGNISGLTQYSQLSNLGMIYVRRISESETDAAAARTVARGLFQFFTAKLLLTCRQSMLLERWLRGPLIGDNESDKSWRPVLAFAADMLEKACYTMEEVISDADDWCVVGCALLPVIRLACLQVVSRVKAVSLKQEHEYFDCIRQAAHTLIAEKRKTMVIEVARSITLAAVARTCDFFLAEGEKLNAYETAHLGRRLSQERDNVFCRWFEATALSLEGEETILTEFDPDEISFTAEGEDDAHPELEAIACRLRQSMRYVNVEWDIGGSEDKLLALWELVNRSIATCKDAVVLVLLLWYRGTAEMALSEMAARQHDLNKELHYAKESHRSCQTATSSLASVLKHSRKSSKSSLQAWREAVIKTLPIRLREREIECKRRLAEIYLKSGDWRKAFANAYSAIESARYAWSSNLDGASTFKRLLALSRSSPCMNSQDVQLRRTLLRIVARATAIDLVRDGFNENFAISAPWNVSSKEKIDLNWQLESIICGTYVLQMLRDCESLQGGQELLSEIKGTVESMLEVLLARSDIQNVARAIIQPTVNVEERLAPMVLSTLKMITARDSCSVEPCEQTIRMCQEMRESLFASNDNRAEASYMLGLMKLRIARKRGELAYLWNRHSNIVSSEKDDVSLEATAAARDHFLTCLKYLGSTSGLLTRQALRCLALVSGPKFADIAESACAFVHSSIGRDLRLRTARRFGSAAPFECDDVEWSISALDNGFCLDDAHKETVRQFFRVLEDRMPAGWRVVGMTLCPTGELLLSSVEVGQDGKLRCETVCIFSGQNEQDGSFSLSESESSYSKIVAPFDELISLNNLHLQQPTIGKSADEEQSKRNWWNRRAELDQRLQNHIETVEAEWFESEAAARVLLGSRARGNLCSRFDAVSEATESSGDHPTRGGSESTPLLILDENLHRFPFEAMSCLEGRAVCRPASLSFVLAKLQECTDSIDDTLNVDPHQVSCILDPESNLGATKDRMNPFLESLNHYHGANWKFAINERPTKEFVLDRLSTRNGLLLYVGHGAGGEYFSRRTIEDTICHEDNSNQRAIQSSVVLMGCSSGRLESVNRKNTKCVASELPIYFEPEGIAQSYLAAGAPCVVANLWDVTDKDIDRFSMDMLGRFFKDDSSSLAECVALARSSCKMSYLVGCAPVCYGLPVKRK